MADPGFVAVIGGGPAGLTAAYELTRAGVEVTVFEGDDVVGGISRTVERDGWRFDLGGHRFFTKVPEVEALWHEILPDDEFLTRQRKSRIFYDGKLFDYPLQAKNALFGLGLIEAAKCVLSYLWVKIRPPQDQSNFEGWVAARFGWRLYRIFFKTYSEKVWGMPATEIQADWAAQRIKNLSLLTAVINSLLPKRKQTEITTLIEEFQYPMFGPGLMWDRCLERVSAGGGKVLLKTRVATVHLDAKGATGVTVASEGGETRYPCNHVVSSMPLGELVMAMDPPAPARVQEAAKGLYHRDFLTVALVVPEEHGFPDNWIYIHSPGVKVGRIQNFGSWSPFLVKDGRTCLGLEYFVNVGDELWMTPDDQLIPFATAELVSLGLLPPDTVQAGYVVRMPKAYPVYDGSYQHNVDVVREWLAEAAPNVHPVGRNGMHKYNIQDHSMYTAMLSVENILGQTPPHDIWRVNVEKDYHEEGSRPTSGGTGRSAPVLPTRQPTPTDVNTPASDQ